MRAETTGSAELLDEIVKIGRRAVIVMTSS
jgi:hypothetical protein